MPKNLSPLLLRAACGFVLGLAIWGGLSQPYARALGFLTESALRIAERPAITRLVPNATMLVVDRSDVASSPTSMHFAVETTDITFNLIVLITLFAAGSHPFADRNVAGFFAAACGLVVVHVAAVASFIQADYATNFGTWSETHYGYVARRVWVSAPYFYSIIGAYGSAVALWWLFRPAAQPAARQISVRPRFAAHRQLKRS